MFKRCIFTFLLLLLSSPAIAQRLSGDVIPSHYDIAVTPDLPAATFSGTERIVVTLKKPSSDIVLNAAEIEFDKVVVKSAPWKPDYQQKVNSGQAQMYLLGWTGDFGDPDNFLGTFFGAKSPSWGFDNKAIFDKLTAARQEPDKDKRIALYKEANKLIMDFLPGVPYVHTSPAVGLAKNVKGYKASPVGLDKFALVSLG